MNPAKNNAIMTLCTLSTRSCFIGWDELFLAPRRYPDVERTRQSDVTNVL
ncbi:MAG: hypothetical protein OXI81_06655 [Paracoccaceae bacterium]|nr:hypothetical protein [Paracoccaceae bacterium]